MRVDPDAALSYLDFVSERHKIWEARQAGAPQPWTADPILGRLKFTNMFRVLDPGSQYPLVNLYNVDDPAERLARAWLYRHTNLPAPWEAVERALGGFPLLSRAGGPEAVYEALSGLREAGSQWSSGAYILRPESVGGKHVIGGDKLEFFTRRTRELFVEDRHSTLTDFLATEDPEERHAVLMRPEGVGGFMAWQIIQDFNYTLDVDLENTIVVPGPGTIRGAAEFAPGENPSEVVRFAQELLAEDGPRLYGRPMSLCDVSNSFCEFFKFCREQKKPKRAVKPYRPAHPGGQPALILPRYYP